MRQELATAEPTRIWPFGCRAERCDRRDPSAGDNATAESILLESLDLGRRHRLPHQIQRAIRIARRAHDPDLAEHADIILAQLCGETLFDQQCA